MKICVLGSHELDYPRNRMMQRLVRAAGFEIRLCHSRAKFPRRHIELLRAVFHYRNEFETILVTEGGHRLVPLLRILASLLRKRIIFDPFISRYNTRIEDRKLYRACGLQALICKWQDWSSVRAAHEVIFDTAEHRDYFENFYGLGKRLVTILPVMVDEKNFRADIYHPPESEFFDVFFYGTFIPLQGIEWILDAAAQLKNHPQIRFRILGAGQTLSEMKKKALALQLSHVNFFSPVKEKDLPHLIGQAHCLLGIFGTGKKSNLVIPNKVVQAAAMGKAIVTRDSPSVRRFFRHEDSVLCVPPGDGKALAAVLRRLCNDKTLQNRLEKGARKVFEKEFSIQALVPRMRNLLLR